MSNSKYLVYASYIVVASVLVYVLFSFMPSSNPSGASTFESKIIGETGPGDVSVELTPLNVNDNKIEMGISINTHSVDLSQFNLKEITTLEYNGKEIKPSETPTLGGHHVSGTLVFNVEEKPENMKVTITDIPIQKERIFEWR